MIAAPDEHEALLQASAAGDQQAFSKLYDLIAAPAFGLISRVVRDPAISEEVAQEAMLEIWRSASRYSPDRGSARSWMLTIAHRRAVDRVRNEQAGRNRNDRVGRLDAAGQPWAANSPDAVDGLAMRSAVALLSPLQRESIDLAYYGGHTCSEIASMLDVPLGTVKTRIRDGLTRLRAHFGESDE